MPLIPPIFFELECALVNKIEKMCAVRNDFSSPI